MVIKSRLYSRSSRTFTELLENAGLTTPFEESCLRGVSEAAKAWLDSYDLTGIL